MNKFIFFRGKKPSKYCLELYELELANFVSGPEWACQAFKNTKVKLDLSTDINMLLMVEKGIGGGICQAIHRYSRANNKYMKDYTKKGTVISLILECK